MAELLAIVFQTEDDAGRAATDPGCGGPALGVEPDALAVLVRDGDGAYRLQTTHHALSAGPAQGIFWEVLLSELVFVPVLGMPVGPGLAPALARAGRIGLDSRFAEAVRDLLQPGTSAIFAVVERVDEAALGRLGNRGGRVLRGGMAPAASAELARYLHGEAIGA